MATRSASLPRARETTRPPYDAIVAVCAVLVLPLWFVEIHTAFGLPAHPLILHVPVIFVQLHEHAEAGQTLRLFVIGLTAVLVAWMLGRNRLAASRRTRIPLQLLTAVLALGSIYFVLRAGHLGAELAWARDH